MKVIYSAVDGMDAKDADFQFKILMQYGQCWKIFTKNLIAIYAQDQETLLSSRDVSDRLKIVKILVHHLVEAKILVHVVRAMLVILVHVVRVMLKILVHVVRTMLQAVIIKPRPPIFRKKIEDGKNNANFKGKIQFYREIQL